MTTIDTLKTRLDVLQALAEDEAVQWSPEHITELIQGSRDLIAVIEVHERENTRLQERWRSAREATLAYEKHAIELTVELEAVRSTLHSVQRIADRLEKSVTMRLRSAGRSLTHLLAEEPQQRESRMQAVLDVLEPQWQPQGVLTGMKRSDAQVAAIRTITADMTQGGLR